MLTLTTDGGVTWGETKREGPPPGDGPSLWYGAAIDERYGMRTVVASPVAEIVNVPVDVSAVYE
jgi:hypothetical protein